MAEQKRDKFNITLHVYDEEITVNIDREQEEFYRRAAKLVNERYNIYAAGYKGRISDHKISLYVLIDIALHCAKLEAKNDTDRYNDILDKLTAKIDDVLESKGETQEQK